MAARGEVIGGHHYSSDEEAPLTQNKQVEDWSARDRKHFIKKVFLILGAQLLFTGCFIAASQAYINKVGFTAQNSTFIGAMGLIGSIGGIAILCSMMCCMEWARQFPTNYILLCVFTIFETAVCVAVAINYKTESVAIVAGVTGALVLALSLYAIFTETDFTGCGPFLFVALIGLLIISLLFVVLSACGVAMSIPMMLLNGAIAILTCFFIVYDVQLIVGGKNRMIAYQLDDYCFAAINIYIDIVRLFLVLLELFGSRR